MNKRAPNDRAIEGKGVEVKATKSAKADEEILERIRSRMRRCIDAESENRKAMVDDLKFLAGEQWPADVMAQRNTDKLPCLTINRLPTIVHQVTNSARENRPSINVSPVGDRGDKEAAKMYRGLIRQIERHSKADIAYDTALWNSASNGLGYLRLTTEWEREDSFDQVMMIKRVRNPFTVYLDPDRLEPDGADARFGFVTEIMPEDDFKREYPKAQKVPFDLGAQGEKYKAWTTKDGIRVAEYYEVTQEPRTLVSLSTGYIGWEDKLDDLTQQKIKNGSIDVLDERESWDRKVKHYTVTAIEILDRTDWLGKWVPIIPVIGDEIDIEGKVKYSGVIRNAKDSQRMYNYWRTKETESIALAPMAPYIMEEGQLEGHEREWKSANTKANPVLTYKGTSVSGRPAPPPQRSQPPPIPAGFVNAAEGAAQDIMSTTGIRFDASVQERMKDESGKAIIELQRKGDVGAFHYVDNLARSMKHLGDMMIDLIPKLYDRKRVMTILREDDTEEQITLDPMAPKAYDEKQTDKGTMKTFNPTTGEYGVTVDIGPSYATKRIEAGQSMMEFVHALPNTASLVMDLIAAEMDWPGADKIASRLAKAIPAQLLTPDQKDVPPQVAALIQNLEAQTKQLGQQLQAAMHALDEKGADRAIAQDKIDKDFEAKILAIIEKTEKAGNDLVMRQLELIIEQTRHAKDQQVSEQRADKNIIVDQHNRTQDRQAALEQQKKDKPDA